MRSAGCTQPKVDIHPAEPCTGRFCTVLTRSSTSVAATTAAGSIASHRTKNR